MIYFLTEQNNNADFLRYLEKQFANNVPDPYILKMKCNLWFLKTNERFAPYESKRLKVLIHSRQIITTL